MESSKSLSASTLEFSVPRVGKAKRLTDTTLTEVVIGVVVAKHVLAMPTVLRKLSASLVYLGLNRV